MLFMVLAWHDEERKSFYSMCGKKISRICDVSVISGWQMKE
jgi:hypothetical protein